MAEFRMAKWPSSGWPKAIMRRNGAVYMAGGRSCPSARGRRRALSAGVAFSPENDANPAAAAFLSEALAAKLGRQGAAAQAMYSHKTDSPFARLCFHRIEKQ
jgi:hypothetical protein